MPSALRTRPGRIIAGHLRTTSNFESKRKSVANYNKLFNARMARKGSRKVSQTARSSLLNGCQRVGVRLGLRLPLARCRSAALVLSAGRTARGGNRFPGRGRHGLRRWLGTGGRVRRSGRSGRGSFLRSCYGGERRHDKRDRQEGCDRPSCHPIDDRGTPTRRRSIHA